MGSLTEKELTTIEDQLSLEENIVKKYKLYAQSCTDPQLKAQCEQIASKHQNHFNMLYNHLGR